MDDPWLHLACYFGYRYYVVPFLGFGWIVTVLYFLDKVRVLKAELAIAERESRES